MQRAPAFPLAFSWMTFADAASCEMKLELECPRCGAVRRIDCSEWPLPYSMVAATPLRCTAVSREGAACTGTGFARISADSWHDEQEIEDRWHRQML
jgi:hypothetical protein